MGGTRVKARDTLSYSFGAIRLRKVRSGLTTLGIVIGVGAIVALLSFTQGFQVAITGQFQEGLSTDVVTVQTGSTGFGFNSNGDSDFTLYANDTELINEIDGVVTSSATISKTVTAELDDSERTLSLTGTDFDAYRELYSTFVAEHGVIPDNPADDEMVIGHRLYDPWNNGTNLVELGDTVNVYYTVRNGTKLVPVNKSVTIVGILEEIGAFGFGPSDTGAYISLESAMEYFDSEEVSQIAVKLQNDDSAFIDSISEDIEELFLNEVSVVSATAMLNTISSALDTVEVLLGGIAGISLLVAGIGIMNIMIVSLMERTREIGILKALGSTGRNVLLIFLGEALLIGLIGGALGIGVGALLANFFGRFMGGLGGPVGQRTPMAITPVLTPTLALEALLFGVLVSVVFALYPAWRASKLEPVEALRSE